MKNIITILTAFTFTFISFGQTEDDQNPNFQKSLRKYQTINESNPETKQSVTIQDTYKVEDWREVKEEERDLKAERRHELRKMRIEGRAERRRFNNECRRNNRFNRNRGFNNNW